MNINDKLTKVARDAAHPTPINPVQELLDRLEREGHIVTASEADDGEGSSEVEYEVTSDLLKPMVVIRVSTIKPVTAA